MTTSKKLRSAALSAAAFAAGLLGSTQMDAATEQADHSAVRALEIGTNTMKWGTAPTPLN